MKPKQIPRPNLKGVKPMTAAELNSYHFADRHTRLTPEQLAAIASRQPK